MTLSVETRRRLHEELAQAARNGDKGAAGVLAHHHYGHHADGAWPALYCALRGRGFLPSDAYNHARELAQGRSSTIQLPR